jgi:hypothetical protein
MGLLHWVVMLVLYYDLVTLLIDYAINIKMCFLAIRNRGARA